MDSLTVLSERPLLPGWERAFFESRLAAAGARLSGVVWASGSALPRANAILALGEGPLQALTGQAGLDKWHGSILHTAYGKVVPCYDIARINKNMRLQVWATLACRKAVGESSSPHRTDPGQLFHLNPSLEETLTFLRKRVLGAEEVTVDIETGRGQINTIGFAVSAGEAIAVNVLPERCSAAAYHELWSVLAEILESESTGKILQNFIYEQLFLSSYGIRLRGVTHDTMLCQKFLWPELEMGLDSVGRMYTDMPYWKDDGKSWNNIRDWTAHYRYNCLDNVGTWQGAVGQRADLAARNLTPLWENYVKKLFPKITEMCSWGIPVSAPRRDALRATVEQDYAAALAELRVESGAESLNPRSPAQVKSFLLGKGYELPKKRDAKTGSWKPSTDEKALKKLRHKHPGDGSLSSLLRLSKYGKALSSYLTWDYSPDGRMRYSLSAIGTETMRMSGHCDPWDRGVNPQTVPEGNKGINIKLCFEASPGHLFFEVDLAQAESRFVAYDAGDLSLIKTLEDPQQDIHKNVAREILRTLRRPEGEYSKFWRQLGKKSGHGANYSMGANTFIDTVIAEMDYVLTAKEAEGILGAYHSLFPGIRSWHKRIREELARTRKLTTPFGWERQFFGRLSDDTFREAYAFRPQSTIPWVINLLMFYLCDEREAGRFDFRLLLQTHDSLLLEVPEGEVLEMQRATQESSAWHPEIQLSGGRLVIPTESKAGKVWGETEKLKGGNNGGN